MIGILIITHGDMAKGIESSVDLIVGKQEQFSTIGLYEGEDFEKFKLKVKDTVEELNTGDGVIILVDLFGASPYNSVAYNITNFYEKKIPIRLLTGVNLPMVIEVLTSRATISSINDLYHIALDSGRDGIKEALEELGL
ncbi:PTS sugar transporter subunit IIA [Clostridium thermopalmarium]|nr:PTS sugar transporter subunit IIA [Clostridium thermopalmarium]PRR68818.1 PTS system mannose-specific EIIAB component [Clostridium thermopalmarium DSM 5974]PVZ22600.1 PTS system mannose-specific IIA component [Clostridium thermopalmarium DSM 5974]